MSFQAALLKRFLDGRNEVLGDVGAGSFVAELKQEAKLTNDN